MAIYHAFTKDGGFVAADSANGFTSYAYPSSFHATQASRRGADKVAQEMMDEARNWSSVHATESGRRHDAHNWKLLMDSTADHAERACLDAAMERLGIGLGR